MVQGCAGISSSLWPARLDEHGINANYCRVGKFLFARYKLGLIALLVLFSSGCHVLTPRPIPADPYFTCDEQVQSTKPVIERGREMPVLDTIGWIIGIPSKIILWDSRVDRHCISPETEQVLVKYIEDNGLYHVKFRLNQYAPIQDWHRLRANKSVGWGWRYTLGVLSLAGEAILPGRVFGGDRYNPYTATVHLYSDVPAIALHEAAHAKDFSRRKYAGTYAAVYLVPGVPLWHESIASRDVVAYLQYLGDPELEKEGYHILYPAYGTYVGSAAGSLLPDYANPLYIGGVLWGHAVGRWNGAQVNPETYRSVRDGTTTTFEIQPQANQSDLLSPTVER
jgi:hypothetical protein